MVKAPLNKWSQKVNKVETKKSQKCILIIWCVFSCFKHVALISPRRAYFFTPEKSFAGFWGRPERLGKAKIPSLPFWGGSGEKRGGEVVFVHCHPKGGCLCRVLLFRIFPLQNVPVHIVLLWIVPVKMSGLAFCDNELFYADAPYP